MIVMKRSIVSMIKKLVYGVSLCIVILSSFYLIVSIYYPSFGGDLSDEEKQSFESLPNFSKGRFTNRKDVPKKVSLMDTVALTFTYFTTSVKDDVPNRALPIEMVDRSTLDSFKDTRII